MIDGGEYINIVSYGGGANSTALLVGLHQHRIPVDLILFADTGGEHPHTYAYLDIMDRWLEEHGMPKITRVYKTTRDGRRLTLEDECLKSGTLPSIAYGFKRCSLKHKIGPQEKFCNNYPPCRKVWSRGKRWSSSSAMTLANTTEAIRFFCVIWQTQSTANGIP